MEQNRESLAFINVGFMLIGSWEYFRIRKWMFGNSEISTNRMNGINQETTWEKGINVCWWLTKALCTWRQGRVQGKEDLYELGLYPVLKICLWVFCWFYHSQMIMMRGIRYNILSWDFKICKGIFSWILSWIQDSVTFRLMCEVFYLLSGCQTY